MNTTSPAAVNLSLEVIMVPVNDIDRAVRFYVDQVGFTLDVDYAPNDAFRVVQLTPPGSSCSIQIGKGLTDAPAGSLRNAYLVVTDLEAAKTFYTALLGAPPAQDAPYYVGYEAAGQQIGLVPGGGEQGMTSPVAYWHVSDLEARLAAVTAAGGSVKEEPHEVAPGRRVATFTDPDGNVLGLLQDS